MEASTLNIWLSSKFLLEELELMNRKKEMENGVDIYSDLSYHLLFILNGYLTISWGEVSLSVWLGAE